MVFIAMLRDRFLEFVSRKLLAFDGLYHCQVWLFIVLVAFETAGQFCSNDKKITHDGW